MKLNPILINYIIIYLACLIIYIFIIFLKPTDKFQLGVAGVAGVAPHIALCVVAIHFAIAINGALKTLLDLSSAVIDEASDIIFLFWSLTSGFDAHVFLKSSNIACGFW
jgi:hypothetical protein